MGASDEHDREPEYEPAKLACPLRLGLVLLPDFAAGELHKPGGLSAVIRRRQADLAQRARDGEEPLRRLPGGLQGARAREGLPARHGRHALSRLPQWPFPGPRTGPRPPWL